MKGQQEERKVRFDWVFLNCVKVIYVCDFNEDKLEPIVLPKNAASFLNTEAEYLRYLHEWEDGESLEDTPER